MQEIQAGQSTFHKAVMTRTQVCIHSSFIHEFKETNASQVYWPQTLFWLGVQPNYKDGNNSRNSAMQHHRNNFKTSRYYEEMIPVTDSCYHEQTCMLFIWQCSLGAVGITICFSWKESQEGVIFLWQGMYSTYCNVHVLIDSNSQLSNTYTCTLTIYKGYIDCYKIFKSNIPAYWSWSSMPLKHDNTMTFWR